MVFTTWHMASDYPDRVKNLPNTIKTPLYIASEYMENVKNLRNILETPAVHEFGLSGELNTFETLTLC